MNIFRTLALGAFAVASAAAMTGTASARVVCNEDGDCWHSREVRVYPPGLGLTIHENDDWKWAEGEKHHWREHEGKGYWRGGEWRED